MSLIELSFASKSSQLTSTQQAFTIMKQKLLIEEHLLDRFKIGKNSRSALLQSSSYEE